MLTIQFQGYEDNLPEIHRATQLEVLELWLGETDVILPELARSPSLSTIYFNDDEGGSLLRNFALTCPFNVKCVGDRRIIRLAEFQRRD